MVAMLWPIKVSNMAENVRGSLAPEELSRSRTDEVPYLRTGGPTRSGEHEVWGGFYFNHL